MKKRRLLWRILRKTGFMGVFAVYLVYFLAIALVLFLHEPGIHNYGEGVWFCFAAATTIGFGDVVVTTMIGRVLTITLAVYSIGITAMFTAVISNYFINLSELRANESAEAFRDQLEHLPELSHEELVDLSEKVKRWGKKH